MKKFHAEGRLTPPQEFLCQDHMPAEELYDLDSDPDQIHNLAAEALPEVREELAKMRAALETWMREVHDPGPVPVDAAAPAPVPGGKRKGRKP